MVLDQLRTVGPAIGLLRGDYPGELSECELLGVTLALFETRKSLTQVEVHVVGLEVGLVLGAAPGVGRVDGAVQKP